MARWLGEDPSSVAVDECEYQGLDGDDDVVRAGQARLNGHLHRPDTFFCPNSQGAKEPVRAA